MGLRYGCHRYRIIGDPKILEGSAAFFAVAGGEIAIAAAMAAGHLAATPS